MAQKTFTWNGPTTYADGSPFGAEDLAGFQLTLDGVVVNLTPAFSPDNTYSYTAEVGFGEHTVSVATVARNGHVSVANPTVTFTVVDDRVPNPPTSLQVA